MELATVIRGSIVEFNELNKLLEQDLCDVNMAIEKLLNSVSDVNDVLDDFNMLNKLKKEILIDLQIWQLNRVFNN
jgi:hypothetical protein